MTYTEKQILYDLPVDEKVEYKAGRRAVVSRVWDSGKK